MGGRGGKAGGIESYRTRFDGKLWADMTEEEHRAHPGDWEAMASQGPITLHSEEHLATSDRGVAMLRRFITRQVERVQCGEDPVGVAFDESDAVVDFSGGQFLLEADAVPVSPATAAG